MRWFLLLFVAVVAVFVAVLVGWQARPVTPSPPPPSTRGTRRRSSRSSITAACPATPATTPPASSPSSRSRGSTAARTRASSIPRARHGGAADAHVPGRADHERVAVAVRLLSGRRSRPRGRRSRLDPLAVRHPARRSPDAAASFDVDKTTTCPRSLAEVDRELRDHPERGMPFGFPPLTQRRVGSDRRLAAPGRGRPGRETRGAEAAEEPPRSPSGRTSSTAAIRRNAARLRLPLRAPLLRAPALRRRARVNGSAWFARARRRGSRSTRSPPAAPTTIRAPGRFYYRLRRIRETLVEKTHVPYRLSDAKLARLRQLFYEPPWSVRRRPLSRPFYQSGKRAANPFLAFAAIPARARYQFILDDARYHRPDVHPRARVPRRRRRSTSSRSSS